MFFIFASTSDRILEIAFPFRWTEKKSLNSQQLMASEISRLVFWEFEQPSDLKKKIGFTSLTCQFKGQEEL